jgi:hypothetical protein
MNWLFYIIDQWIQYLDPLVSEGVPDQAMRLLNGGLWSFALSSDTLTWSAPFNIVIPSVPDSANQVNAGSVVVDDGYVAYVNLNAPLVMAGDTQSGSDVIQNLTYLNQVMAGMNVTGPGIPTGTTVLSVGASSITISQNATATADQVSLVFSAAGPITVQTAQSSSFVPTQGQIIFARAAGGVIYLGVNTSQMILRDGEFKPLLGTGYFDVYTGVAGQSLSAGTVVYISPGSSDSGRTQGAFYPLDVSAANASIRGNFAGVVITAATTGNPATVVYSGFYEFPSVTPGLEYYADPSTPGGITSLLPSIPGEKIVPVGYAVPFGSGSNTASLLVSGGSGSSSLVPAYLLFYQEIIGYGNGSKTTFNTTQPVLNASSLFVYVDGLILPMSQWSLTGNMVTLNSAPAVGVQVYVEYVLANQIYVSANQEVPTVKSSTILQLLGQPPNQSAISLFIDGVILPTSQWSLSIVLGVYTITLDTALAPGQTPYCTYFTPVGGMVSGANNEGSGVGIFDTIVNNILQFKSLVAGANTTITDNHDGTITIASTGGGGSVEVHGSAASPVSINPSVGIAPTTAMEQIWWVQPTTSGLSPITASPAIAPGSAVGQRLTLKSVASSNYLQIPNGSGTDQNNLINMGPFAQTITYTWDGTNWSEDSRRV